MPAKTPIYLKTTSNKRGKKFKLRDILSPDMISPPLGDFRHTIHIGNGGEHDVFGDISFLQGKYDLLPGHQGKSKFGQCGGHSEFSRANSTPNPTFPDASSSVLKNAISLPSIGGCQALNLPLLTSVTFVTKRDLSTPPKLPHFHSAAGEDEPWENEKGITERKDSKVLQHSEQSTKHSCSFTGKTLDCKTVEDDSTLYPGKNRVTRTTNPAGDSLLNLTSSFLSLQLDLGPSILDDVLNVMDRKPQLEVK